MALMSGSCTPGNSEDPCFRGMIQVLHLVTGRLLLQPMDYFESGDYYGGGSYGGSYGGSGGPYGGGTIRTAGHDTGAANTGSKTGSTFGSWGPSPSDEPFSSGRWTRVQVKYDSPTSKGCSSARRSKTCATGEKKYLLLSHIDQMANEHRYKVWVTDYNSGRPFGDPANYLYQGDGWANNVDFMNGYDLETHQKHRFSAGKPATDLRQDAQVLQRRSHGETEYRYDVFPNAVELCVPTNA